MVRNIFRHMIQRLHLYGTFCTGKAVYLTFDDGPIPEVTPKVLAILDKYHVKATFFMVGENIDKHPDVFAQVVAAGHGIGNHTYNHLKGWNYSLQEYMENVQKWENSVQNNLPPSSFHFSPFTLFRPPYGKATLAQRRALTKAGYKIIYWDVLTQDYNPTKSPEWMLKKIQREVCPGSIINFHDSLKSNERMLAVLPKAIEWLQANGYQIGGKLE